MGGGGSPRPPSRRIPGSPGKPDVRTADEPEDEQDGSHTIRNQIPAVAIAWRIEIRLAVASSTVVAGSQSLLAASTATTGMLNEAVSVESSHDR